MTNADDIEAPAPIPASPYALVELAPLEATEEGRAVAPPPGLAAGRARFDRARAAYHAGRYDEAATAFLEAARTLPRGPGRHADTLAANRAAAYRNAAHASLLAASLGATAPGRPGDPGEPSLRAPTAPDERD